MLDELSVHAGELLENRPLVDVTYVEEYTTVGPAALTPNMPRLGWLPVLEILN